MNERIVRVLVVDDVVEFLEMARRSMPGRTVLVERDGAQVEARVREEKPDLVILDQWLNDGIRGHDVANAIKRENPEQLIALWSAGMDVMVMRYLYKHSSTDHVDVKTSDFEQLIAHVTGEAVIEEPDWDAVPRVNRLRKEIALRMLARSGGNKSAAARRLGKDRTTLIRWLSSDEADQ